MGVEPSNGAQATNQQPNTPEGQSSLPVAINRHYLLIWGEPLRVLPLLISIL